MPYPNEHAVRLQDPKTLEERDGFLRVARTHGSGKGEVQGAKIPTTIDVIWYVFKDGTVIAQALRFPLSKWTVEQAKAWVKEHKIKYLSFEAATGKSSEEPLTKNFSCKVKDIDEKGVVSIYVNGFDNVDSDNDISAQGSFDKTIKENFNRIKHLKDHDTRILLGCPMEFRPDNYGLMVVSAMNIEKQLVKDVYSDYKFFAEHNRSLEHSIGYRVIKCNNDEETGIRTITEYKLYEYSTLSFLGANENTPCVGIKAAGLSLKEDMKLLQEMLVKGDYSDEKYKLIEEKITQIKSRIEEMKTLGKEEPSKDTQFEEPDSLFENPNKQLNYFINNIKF